MPTTVMLAAAEGGTSSGGIGTIVSATTDVVSLVSNVFDIMVSNPLLLFFVAVGVLSAAIGVFAHLKHVAK
ncbi:MAG: hypothetical protein HDQ98_14520 [Lachnospiraceae bacterium]|nr:hypothetical protein [Lachnospiraceae bacterium]MBD5533387.1 hypothetical protein [Lachnospiraceae bacterium]